MGHEGLVEILELISQPIMNILSKVGIELLGQLKTFVPGMKASFRIDLHAHLNYCNMEEW